MQKNITNTGTLQKKNSVYSEVLNAVASVGCEYNTLNFLAPKWRFSKEEYRTIVCGLCEKLVCAVFSVSLEHLQARTRCSAEVALARQIAMYLCHTSFSILLTDVGHHFGRDRTTVAYACGLIEDKRDDWAFDQKIIRIENLLMDIIDIFSLHGALEASDEGKPPERFMISPVASHKIKQCGEHC